MTTRWKLTLEYDGAGFCGWQRQAEDITVQAVIETAIHAFSGETVRLHVAGRTDAGVHALAQIAHFDLEKGVKAVEVLGGINYHARPHRVVVVKAEEAPPDFHARFSALSRRYRYQIINRPASLALMEGKAWHVVRPMFLEPMQKAAALLIGTHDFSTFRAQRCQATSPVRTLDELTITQVNEAFFFDVMARSFLYHQVRNMVGTLAKVGTGQWTVDEFAAAFAAAERVKGGPTAPPDGLYFVSVAY